MEKKEKPSPFFSLMKSVFRTRTVWPQNVLRLSDQYHLNCNSRFYKTGSEPIYNSKPFNTKLGKINKYAYWGTYDSPYLYNAVTQRDRRRIRQTIRTSKSHILNSTDCRHSTAYDAPFIVQRARKKRYSSTFKRYANDVKSVM